MIIKSDVNWFMLQPEKNWANYSGRSGTNLCWLLSPPPPSPAAARCRLLDPTSISSARTRRQPAEPWKRPRWDGKIPLPRAFPPLWIRVCRNANSFTLNSTSGKVQLLYPCPGNVLPILMMGSDILQGNTNGGLCGATWCGTRTFQLIRTEDMTGKPEW